MPVSTTPNIGINKYDDGDTGWSTGQRANADLLDSLYRTYAGDPNSNILGSQNEIIRQTDTSPHALWMCQTGGTDNTWVKVGLLVKSDIVDVRNVWTANQALEWISTSASAEALNFTPTVENSFIYINYDTNLTINAPTGRSGDEASTVVLEIEKTGAGATSLTWAGISFNLAAEPPEMSQFNVIRVVLYYSPASGGVWRGEWTALN